MHTTAMANVRFCLMTRDVRRPREMAYGILERSSDISIILAISSATSVPAEPIAIPTDEAAKAGASFTLSPIIATFPVLDIFLTMATLSINAELVTDLLSCRFPVPCQYNDRIPICFNLYTVSFAFARITS